MKKLNLIALSLLTVGTLTACGEVEVKEKEVKQVETVGDEEKTEKEVVKEEGNEVKELNKVIVDNNSIKATLVSVEHIVNEEWNEEKIEVKFEVENKRPETIEVQAREVSTDGKMVDDSLLMMSQEVSSGKIADAVLTIQDYEGGELPSIEQDLEMLLHVFSWDNYDFQEDHKVDISFK